MELLTQFQTAGRSTKLEGAFRFQPDSSEARSKSARLWLLLLLLVAGGREVLGAENEVTKEYQVKAAFLYNFAKFVEWPATAMPNGKSPIIIGVFGKNPFGDQLEKLVKDKTVNERSFQVRQSSLPEHLRFCHMVFVSSEEEKRLPELFAALRGGSVLTVGESAKFADSGGIISFVEESGKLRFEIDADAGSRAGLRISAQLLKLAKTVRGAREVGERR